MTYQTNRVAGERIIMVCVVKQVIIVGVVSYILDMYLCSMYEKEAFLGLDIYIWGIWVIQ